MMTKLPKGYYVEWSGQWENQIRANKTLSLILPIVVLIIFLILYFTYKSMKEALITMITVPFALIEGILWSILWINLSVAVAVGFISFWDGDRNSYDNDYLLERGHEQDG
jgi:Cu(I)/Ag(I) efflux system membrane protein CusA/SilA